MRCLTILFIVGMSSIEASGLDIPSAIEQCKAQCRFDSLYVEYNVVFTILADDTREIRDCRFEGKGADFYVSFEETFDPPKIKAPRNLHCTRELYEYLYRGGQWKWRLRNFISELPIPSEGGFENEAAHMNLQGFWPTARTMLGVLGPETREQRSATGISLVEFLGKEGPFRLSEEDGVQVLSHEAAYSNGESEQKVSADIWLDATGRISRIDEVDRIWDLDEATIAKYYTGSWFALRCVLASVEGSDFVETPSGFRYPKSAVVTDYGITPEKRAFLKKKSELPPDEYAVRRLTFPTSPYWQFVIEATKVEVNQPIPDDLLDMKFSEGSVVYSDEKLEERRIVEKPPEPRWYVRHSGWVMAGLCVLVVAVAGFVAQRWLGWRG